MSVHSGVRDAATGISINPDLSRRDKVPSARMNQDLMRPIKGLPHFASAIAGIISVRT